MLKPRRFTTPPKPQQQFQSNPGSPGDFKRLITTSFDEARHMNAPNPTTLNRVWFSNNANRFRSQEGYYDQIQSLLIRRSK